MALSMAVSRARTRGFASLALARFTFVDWRVTDGSVAGQTERQLFTMSSSGLSATTVGTHHPHAPRKRPTKQVSRSVGFAICSPRGIGEPHDIVPRGS